MSLSATQSAYLAGFLDGDGSIYVRLKPNPTYRYGFQVAPYIVLFQSAKDREKFKNVCKLVGCGYVRERSDGVLEHTINRMEDLKTFLSIVKPYVILKKEQVKLMLKILRLKSKVKNKKDFGSLMELIDSFRDLNYSKTRKIRVLTP